MPRESTRYIHTSGERCNLLAQRRVLLDSRESLQRTHI